ncbi:MAG: hypothetical protein P4L31_01465, partial [Candidatus Babeliales bacterium]|nr:hypothetical protein [Candidatus Babeliales bacterium]
INTGTDKTTLNALRRKVQKLEDTPALQTKPHQLQCGNTQYTNFQAMKNDLKVMEAEKSHIIGMTLGGACALTHEALKLLSDQNS